MLVEIDEGGNERTQLYVLGEASRSSAIRASSTGRRTSRATGAARVHDEPPQRPSTSTSSCASSRAGRSGSSSSAATSASTSISPDGRWVVGGSRRRARRRLGSLPARRRDGRGRARDAARGRGGVRARPSGSPTRPASHARRTTGRDTFAIVCDGEDVVGERSGISTARRRAGRRLLVVANEDGYSRLTCSTPRRSAPRRGAAAGRRRRRPLRLLAGRVAARVRVLDADRAARRSTSTTSTRASRGSSPSPRDVERRARRADAAPLRELRRRVDSGLPLRAGGRRPVPGRRHGARRPGGAVAAVVLVELRRR